MPAPDTTGAPAEAKMLRRNAVGGTIAAAAAPPLPAPFPFSPWKYRRQVGSTLAGSFRNWK